MGRQAKEIWEKLSIEHLNNQDKWLLKCFNILHPKLCIDNIKDIEDIVFKQGYACLIKSDLEGYISYLYQYPDFKEGNSLKYIAKFNSFLSSNLEVISTQTKYTLPIVENNKVIKHLILFTDEKTN